jgi:hypothetical protein
VELLVPRVLLPLGEVDAARRVVQGDAFLDEQQRRVGGTSQRGWMLDKLNIFVSVWVDVLTRDNGHERGSFPLHASWWSPEPIVVVKIVVILRPQAVVVSPNVEIMALGCR